MEQIELLKKRLAREKSARSQAEELLEKKSLELFNLNKALEKQNFTLHQEIDDREKAEKILEEKTTLLNNLFSNSMESSIAATDLNLRITYFNPMAEKLFGYKAKEVIGKTVHEIHVMEDVEPERLEFAIGQVKKKGEYKYQVIQGSDENKRIINSRVAPIKDQSGNMTGYVLFSMDVTAQTLIEQRFKLQSVALESAVDAIGITDREGHAVWVNKAFTTLTGYEKKEVIGSNLRILQSGKHDKLFYKDLWDTIIAGNVWSSEIINKRKTGSLYHEEMTITPVKDFLGKVVNFITISRDITLRKNAEKELKKSKDAAEKANLAKGEFLANMSHEIRTPLNGAISMLNLLEASVLNTRQRDYVDMAMISVESLLAIINDILNFSKIEAGMLALESEPFNLEFELNRFIRPFITKAEKNGVELIFGFDPNMPQKVVGDLLRIKQVLDNLLSNAFKFTSEGYIWVNVHCCKITGKSVEFEISVQDTGIGIPEEKQALIFDFFTQADASTTRKFGGTGLGLAICKQLSELMGGSLKLVSFPQKGSTFCVTLSLPIDESKPDPYKTLDMTWFTRKRILLLDDNQINLNLFSGYLDFFNIRYDVFQSSDTAFKAMKKAKEKKDPFHMVIIDHSLPDMTGVDFGKQILSHEDFKKVKLILMSSMEMLHQTGELENHGFCACIPKPVGLHDFLNILSMAGLAKKGSVITLDMLNTDNAGDNKSLKHAVTTTDFKKILIVEDNEINQLAAKMILEQIGFKMIEIAGNGEKAFEMIRKNAYDLVFMDIQMPVMDGLTATGKIRAWEKERIENDKHLPLIAMTANAIEGDREKCIKAGMDDYISKPIRKENLISILTQWAGVKPVHQQR